MTVVDVLAPSLLARKEKSIPSSPSDFYKERLWLAEGGTVPFQPITSPYILAGEAEVCLVATYTKLFQEAEDNHVDPEEVVACFPKLPFFAQNQPQGHDPNVRRVEDKILAVTSRSRSSPNGHFPERPGFGTKGREILLWTNYFELTAYGNLILYRYSITVAPDRNGKIPAGKKQRRLVQLLLEEHFDQHGTDIVTDFKSNVLSRVQLDLEDEYQVTYRDEEAQEPSPNATTYRIAMGSAAVLSFADLLDLVTSTQSNALFASKEQLIQALNIVIGHHPKATAATASIGASNHFDTTPGSDRFRLAAGLQAIRGFFVSVRAATARILVNVQVKHGAFYEGGPLDRLMHAFMEVHGPEKAKLEVFLKKLFVNVTHIQRKDRHGGNRPRIKQINALASPGDGRELAHPPIIPSYGAGPKAVMFFLASIEPASASSGPRQPAKGTVRQDTPQGKYISVFDFFKRSGYRVIQLDKSLR
ncbi:hypothetical protein LTR96_011086 [Exophiala xenobiotica]|nr:hypothetical protein LTR96_011086 [Exophiala xenobiotica]